LRLQDGLIVLGRLFYFAPNKESLMNNLDRISAICFAIFGLISAVEAYSGIGFGSFNEPAPGFYPFWLSTVLVALSAALLLSNIRNVGEQIPFWVKGAWYRPCFSISVLAVFFIIMMWIGFIASSFFLFLIWMLVIEKEPLKKSLIVSISGSVIFYVVFVVALGIDIPKGLLI